MKYKKTFLALIASLGLLFAAGCGGNPTTPEDVAKCYVEALLDGDVKKADKLSTERTAKVNGMFSSMIKQQKEQNPDQFKDAGKIKSVDVDGDKATVYFEGDNGSLTLVKVDGAWKVDVKK